MIIDEDGDGNSTAKHQHVISHSFSPTNLGRIEYDEYIKWKTEDAGKYGEKAYFVVLIHFFVNLGLLTSLSGLCRKVRLQLHMLRCGLKSGSGQR